MGLGLGKCHGVEQRCFGMHHAHPLAATAGRGLDEHRIADVRGELQDFLFIVADRAVGAGHTRYAGLFHGLDRRDLVAHETDGFGARADENEAALLDALGEVGVLREEAVAGMDRLGVGDFGGADDRRDVEVTVGRARRPDTHRLIRELDILGLAVGHGVQGHGADAERAAGALDAQRNLAAVGYDDFFDHKGDLDNILEPQMNADNFAGSKNWTAERSDAGPSVSEGERHGWREHKRR